MPTKKPATTETRAICASAKVVAENLTALMKDSKKLNSNPKLSELTGLGTGTLSRVKNAKINPTIDTIELLAKAFDLQSWQLLVPNLKPKDHPTLLSEEGRQLFKRLAEEVGDKR